MSNQNDMENKNSLIKFNFKFYQLIILLFLISFIPLVTFSNKVIGGLLFSLLILIFNFECVSKGYSKLKIVLNTFIATLIYYLFTLVQTFFTYINIINEITKRVEISTGNFDIGFTLVNGKLLIMFIPLSITSLIIFRKEKFDKKLFKLAFIINMLIFTSIIY